jgi:hypothetical protein
MIQYSAVLVIDPERHSVLDARRSLVIGRPFGRPVGGHDDAAGFSSQATSESFGMLASTERLRPSALAA